MKVYLARDALLDREVTFTLINTGGLDAVSLASRNGTLLECCTTCLLLGPAVLAMRGKTC